jgi:hypothetical protein
VRPSTAKPSSANVEVVPVRNRPPARPAPEPAPAAVAIAVAVAVAFAVAVAVAIAVAVAVAFAVAVAVAFAVAVAIAPARHAHETSWSHRRDRAGPTRPQNVATSMRPGPFGWGSAARLVAHPAPTPAKSAGVVTGSAPGAGQEA